MEPMLIPFVVVGIPALCFAIWLHSNHGKKWLERL